MQAKIDPLTGGLKWVNLEEQDEELQLLKNKLNSISSITDLVTQDINKNYRPEPSRYLNQQTKYYRRLTLDQRYNLIMSFAEECIQPQELRTLLQNKQNPIAYDGFEPSGRMHIAQGILRAINVNKLIDAGVIFIFWVADWFALLNNKMGGDLEKIKIVGRYFIEVWRAAGMKMHNVKFIWASDDINRKANDYWLQVLNIARSNTVTRITRCQQIMGREESGELQVAQMFYPCMQCCDIFHLKADICSLGLDQRKVNMLAREYAEKSKLQSPIIISHHMLAGLKEGQSKMSKSDADSAIFMEDTEEDVSRKIRKSFCPEKIVLGNPILDYAKHIIFGSRDTFTIERDPKRTQVPSKTYKNYKDLEDDFVKGDVHPADLKPSVAKVLNELIEPVRQHFQNDPYARELLRQIKSFYE